MKSAIAVLAGFATTLMVFGGGIAFAVFYLSAKPVPIQHPNLDVASAWTQQAVEVDTTAQGFERLPARRAADSPANDNEAPAPAVDPVTTAAITADAMPVQQPAAGLQTAHAEWCASQYRSYDPADDSYTAYSGARRRCVSPYDRQAEGPNPADSAIVVSDAVYADRTAGGFAGSDHVQSCFDRYRSYRPEDNTYQPFSGGPRRQCE